MVALFTKSYPSFVPPSRQQARPPPQQRFSRMVTKNVLCSQSNILLSQRHPAKEKNMFSLSSKILISFQSVIFCAEKCKQIIIFNGSFTYLIILSPRYLGKLFFYLVPSVMIGGTIFGMAALPFLCRDVGFLFTFNEIN